jgi:predicted nucleic acid-binding protein
MMEDKRCMVDTNVLVYITVKSNPWYQGARLYLNGLFNDGFELCITSQIMREYLVCLTRGIIFTQKFTSEQALNELDAVLSVFTLLEDAEETFSHLCSLIRKYQIQGKAIHDANIVAVMISHRIKRLATYNIDDFRRFNEIVLEPIS